jgi:hypothetical protein
MAVFVCSRWRRVGHIDGVAGPDRKPVIFDIIGQPGAQQILMYQIEDL